jgi:hypothetical protein
VSCTPHSVPDASANRASEVKPTRRWSSMRPDSPGANVISWTCQGKCRPKAKLNKASLFIRPESHYPLRFTDCVAVFSDTFWDIPVSKTS